MNAFGAPSWNWRPVWDNTRSGSSVQIENLHYGDIPVVGARRKLYRGVPLDRDLGLESFSIDEGMWSEADREILLDSLQMKEGFERTRGVEWKIQPSLLYQSRVGKVVPVWEVRPTSPSIQYLFIDYLEPKTGRLVWRKPLTRKLISAKVYPTSPYNGGSNDAPRVDRDLPVLADSATTLETTHMTVKRQQSVGGGNFDAVHVDPQQNFHASVSDDPNAYNSSCTGSGATSCPNQAFDAVNVFYHVQGYRNYIETLFTAIGETVAWPNDPIMVITNAIAYDVDGDGQTTDETNNAFYTSFCTADAYTGGCLLFNPPDQESYSECGGLKDYYDLAREAIVAVHEYQHYFTDHLTGMEAGSDGPNVGDVLHEGYSDYFAVSHVTRESGTATTTILEYGFQECAIYQRAIGTLKVFDNEAGRTDPHYYGWTWASGLYSLQATLGVSVVDKIAIKSLFYLPTNPTFIDAVEALVLADQNLNAGINRVTIRTLFYDTLRFVGGGANPFVDAERGIVSVGVSSCLATTYPASPYSGPISSIVALLWVVGLVLGARYMVDGSSQERKKQ